MINCKPVSLAFTNQYGANPYRLPVAGGYDVLGVKAPNSFYCAYMLEDGSIWEYKHISPYNVDNQYRINGWECVQDTQDCKWGEYFNNRR